MLSQKSDIRLAIWLPKYVNITIYTHATASNIQKCIKTNIIKIVTVLYSKYTLCLLHVYVSVISEVIIIKKTLNYIMK